MNDLEKLEWIHYMLQEIIRLGVMPHDVEKAIGFIEDIREPYLKAKETS